jgi:hypothetical protein
VHVGLTFQIITLSKYYLHSLLFDPNSLLLPLHGSLFSPYKVKAIKLQKKFLNFEFCAFSNHWHIEKHYSTYPNRYRTMTSKQIINKIGIGYHLWLALPLLNSFDNFLKRKAPPFKEYLKQHELMFSLSLALRINHKLKRIKSL